MYVIRHGAEATENRNLNIEPQKNVSPLHFEVRELQKLSLIYQSKHVEAGGSPEASASFVSRLSYSLSLPFPLA